MPHQIADLGKNRFPHHQVSVGCPRHFEVLRRRPPAVVPFLQELAGRLKLLSCERKRYQAKQHWQAQREVDRSS